MILISRKVDYAILVLCELAKSASSVSARELAAQFNLSRPFIANILKELCRHSFVESARGAKGGYKLGKRPEEISLAMIITALEGSFRLMSCADAPPDAPPPEQETQCSLFHVCTIKSPLQIVHQRLLATLEQVTIAQLIQSPNVVPLGTVSENCASCLS